MIKSVARAAAVIGVMGSAMAAVPATAAAAPESVRPTASAAAGCSWMSRTTTSARVFCDGNGPTRYQLVLYCTQSRLAPGNAPWLGDRRGSYAKCPSGTTIVDYDIFIG
ncbi:hypothetical protein J7E91_34545 [Streptomyces sp. ISL-99]|uniref:hypothetical protein n=1 Tax=Streptomyces sp. ISL-99 TaxID=2819193 RepID=UPI001BE8752D|nr:hypothetical protein [Streptomyces sp. ISL-99]MBT2530333.1 hypothetical protein [Streptomyces sp. ISL-99]